MNIEQYENDIKTRYIGMSKEYILNNKKKISINDAIKYVKFNEYELIDLLGYVNLKKVLVYQNLSLNFICRYILNPHIKRKIMKDVLRKKW